MTTLRTLWLLCLLPLVVVLYFLPWQLNAGLAIAAFLCWARRVSDCG